jgi:hypothetical protein
MVGRGPAVVLITESGFVSSMHWDRLVPSFWDYETFVIVEGTPKQDASHWFTKEAVSGLPDGHEEADRSIAERNPRNCTSRANTIQHAYLPSARTRAAEELQYRGKRWGDLWIYAKWDVPTDVVFDAYDPHVSISKYTPYPPMLDDEKLPPPNRIEIDVDWHRGAAPGACTCTAIWTGRNPLDVKDPRPLMVVVDEFMDDKERLHYTSDGWWRVIKAMRDRWGASAIYADPTGEDLIKRARRHGLKIKRADNTDKLARIQLVNSQCHVGPNGYAALYLDRECQKTAHVLQTLPWKQDRDGNPTDKPSGYNDHLADCLAYAAGRWARTGSMALKVWG